MKFLCVKCDAGMSISNVSGPDESGSLAAVFRCAGCGTEIAMLTNAFETQLVSSLGIKIGPDGEKKGASKCPFTAMVNQNVADENAAETQVKAEDSAIKWTKDAEERLARIPEFVRPMAKKGIEQFAEKQGADVIDSKIIDNAGAIWGME